QRNHKKRYKDSGLQNHQKEMQRWDQSKKKLEEILLRFNTQHQFYFSKLHSGYEEIGGWLADAQAHDAKELFAKIIKEVNRLKHWVGRQFSHPGDSGLARRVDFREVINAADYILKQRGLLDELLEALKNWPPLKA